MAVGLAWAFRMAGAAEPSFPDSRWAMRLFYEPAVTLETQTVYRLTSTEEYGDHEFRGAAS